VFRLPGSHRRRLRTTNMLERLNREIKRRTRVATLFPNEASLLRLISAVLMEQSEEWETGKLLRGFTKRNSREPIRHSYRKKWAVPHRPLSDRLRHCS